MQIVRQENVLTFDTNAGAQTVTGNLCAPHVFRTSFSNWQTSYPCADVMLKAGHKKAVLMFWNYSFGQESMAAFKEGFTKGGGTIVKDRKSTRLNSSHSSISYAVFCLKKKSGR